MSQLIRVHESLLSLVFIGNRSNSVSDTRGDYYECGDCCRNSSYGLYPCPPRLQQKDIDDPLFSEEGEELFGLVSISMIGFQSFCHEVPLDEQWRRGRKRERRRKGEQMLAEMSKEDGVKSIFIRGVLIECDMNPAPSRSCGRNDRHEVGKGPKEILSSLGHTGSEDTEDRDRRVGKTRR
jgi:hypothetical protein